MVTVMMIMINEEIIQDMIENTGMTGVYQNIVTSNQLNTQARTKSEQKSLENDFGIRYSVLLKLPYFDPIRFAVVDPMHNLFLGTGKDVIKVWIEQGILTKKHFEEIEQMVSKFKTPQNIGRIPLKISSGFSGFTAELDCYFSPICLKGILRTNHLRCWLLFVQACRLLCTRIITVEAVDQADKYLLQFCKQFQLLYGREYCTPNMHLHLHLKDCLLDYGPVHSFWCYGFVRCLDATIRIINSLKLK